MTSCMASASSLTCTLRVASLSERVLFSSVVTPFLRWRYNQVLMVRQVNR